MDEKRTVDARRAAMERSAARRKRRRKRRKLPFLFAFLAILLAVCAALSVTVLFPVKQISVAGESRYTPEEIIQAAGVTVGDNIIRVSRSQVETRVRSALPYIDRVELAKSLTGRLQYKVSAAVCAVCYETDGAYLLVSAAGYVIERSQDRPKGCILVSGARFGAVEPGGKLILEGDETNALVDELYSAVSAQNLQATAIDISNPVQLCVVVDDRIELLLGSKSDLVYKISHASASIAQLESDARGTLDLSFWSETNQQAYFKHGT